MIDLLFYLALILLSGSVILNIVYYSIGWKIEKDLLIKLIKDENYPFETIDFPSEGTDDVYHNDFEALWFRIACRKKTDREHALNHHGNWMFFCGLLVLGLALYNFTPLLNVLLSLMSALVGTIIWLLLVISLRTILVSKIAWKIYHKAKH